MQFSDKITNNEASVLKINQRLGIDDNRQRGNDLDLTRFFALAELHSFDVTVFGHNGIVRLYGKETGDCIASAQCICDLASDVRIGLAFAAALVIATGRDFEVQA